MNAIVEPGLEILTARGNYPRFLAVLARVLFAHPEQHDGWSRPLSRSNLLRLLFRPKGYPNGVNADDLDVFLPQLEGMGLAVQNESNEWAFRLPATAAEWQTVADALGFTGERRLEDCDPELPRCANLRIVLRLLMVWRDFRNELDPQKRERRQAMFDRTRFNPEAELRKRMRGV
jgi:hypothetical protein